MAAHTRKELQALQAELTATAPPADADGKPRAPRRRTAKATAPHEAAAETAPPPPDVEDAPEAPDAEPSLSQLQALVRELQDAVHQATESAEDAVTAHPAAALASAFVLGVLVGRAWR